MPSFYIAVIVYQSEAKEKETISIKLLFIKLQLFSKMSKNNNNKKNYKTSLSVRFCLSDITVRSTQVFVRFFYSLHTVDRSSHHIAEQSRAKKMTNQQTNKLNKAEMKCDELLLVDLFWSVCAGTEQCGAAKRNRKCTIFAFNKSQTISFCAIAANWNDWISNSLYSSSKSASFSIESAKHSVCNKLEFKGMKTDLQLNNWA